MANIEGIEIGDWIIIEEDPGWDKSYPNKVDPWRYIPMKVIEKHSSVIYTRLLVKLVSLDKEAIQYLKDVADDFLPKEYGGNDEEWVFYSNNRIKIRKIN